MSQKKRITVFCASSHNLDDDYYDLADKTGRICSDCGMDIVYGGAKGGMMGRIADSAMAAGSEVIGVIPAFMKDRERAHSGLSALHFTQSMHERQQKMADLSDCFLILPGGIGTLAEFFEVITWKQLQLHEKPIILFNHRGYWDSLLAQMRTLEEQKFAHRDHNFLYEVVDSITELEHSLKRKFFNE